MGLLFNGLTGMRGADLGSLDDDECVVDVKGLTVFAV